MYFPRTSLALTLAAIALTVAAGCSHGSDSASLPLGVLDAPTPGQPAADPLLTAGWAIDESGVERVAVYIDRKHVADAQLGIARPDVEKVYPQFASSMVTGFKAMIPSKTYAKGVHELVCRIYAKDGATRDVSNTFVR